MNIRFHSAARPVRFRCAIALALAGVVAGCGRSDVEVYRVAKEQPGVQAAGQTMPPGHPDTGELKPGLKWQLPAGWEEVPAGPMRAASFRVKSKEGKQADIGIFPPGISGSDLDNVNRWRGQVGLPPVSEPELSKLAQTVDVAGQSAQLFEASGAGPNGEKSRILSAIQRRDGEPWFFKMTGADELVAQQKSAFIEFLKSLNFAAAPALPPSHPAIGAMPMPAQPGPAGAGTEGQPAWQVPAGWKEVPNAPFLVAKFIINGAENSQAAVNVSVTGGGLAINVNRWRGQLGLGDLPEAEVNKLLTPLAGVAGGKAVLVDMTGTDAKSGQKARLVGVILTQADKTWYYKLMGAEPLVAQEKPAFVKFMQSVKY
jgi:hypothetical protein